MVSEFMLRLYRNSVYANGFIPLFLFSLYSVKNRVEAKFLEAILVSSGIDASQLSVFDKLGYPISVIDLPVFRLGVHCA